MGLVQTTCNNKNLARKIKDNSAINAPCMYMYININMFLGL